MWWLIPSILTEFLYSCPYLMLLCMKSFVHIMLLFVEDTELNKISDWLKQDWIKCFFLILIGLHLCLLCYVRG